MYSRYYQQHKEENEYMIVIGKHLATTEKFPTREAAEEKINSNRLESSSSNDICMQRSGRIRAKNQTLCRKKN